MITRKQNILVFITIWLVIINLSAALNGSSQGLIRSFLVGPFIVLVPGWLLLSSLYMRPAIGWRDTLYSVGLSLSLILFGGLIFNTVTHFFGLSKPLGNIGIFAFLNVLVIALMLVMNKRLNRSHELEVGSLKAADVYFIVTSLLLPLASIISATVLNNNGENYLTIVSVVFIGVFILISVGFRNYLADRVYPFIIYGIALALLLMYSMRSWHIIGWDINLEYQVFQLTSAAGFWSMDNLPGAEYNACLSITLLPTIIHSLIGGSSEYVFKFFMQAVFAIVPVTIFLFFRTFIGKEIAFLAAIFYASQAWFIEQMPALIRQEVAFIFISLALLVIFDERFTVRQRNLIFGIFSFSIVISHYSSTYVWLAMLFITLSILFFFKFSMKSLRAYVPRIDYRIVIATLIFAFVWNSQLTKTSDATGNFIESAFSRMSEIFTSEAMRGSIEKISFKNININTQENLEKAYEETYRNYLDSPKHAMLYEGQSGYVPTLVDDRRFADAMFTGWFANLYLWASKLIKLLFINVFTILGILIVCIEAISRYKKYRNTIFLDYGALCVSVLPLIFLIIVFPFIQEKYNLTRLFMQVFIVLSFPTIIGALSPMFHLEKFRLQILSLTLVVFFFYSSGLAEQLTGGLARITFQQPGGKYDVFYTYQTEINAARWLSAERNDQLPVYADIIASLRLKGFAGFRDTTQDIFPTTIYKESYVYLGDANINRNRIYRFLKGDMLTYEAPIDFLSENKNKIYSNGGAEIFQ